MITNYSHSYMNTLRLYIFAICGILLVNGQGANPDMCLWGIDGDETVTKFNGLYRFAGFDNNGKEYYRLDRSEAGCTSDPYIYMYVSVTAANNKYVLSGSPPAQDDSTIVPDYFGGCTQLSSDPTTCTTSGGQWTIISGYTGETVQPNAVVYRDFCPTQLCESISIGYTGGSGSSFCDTQIFTQTGDNKFSYAQYTWWFNPLLNIWLCGNSNTDKIPNDATGWCRLNVTVGTSSGRYLTRSNGYLGPFNGGQAAEFPPGRTYTFTCNNPGSGTTTTKPPTTTNPTLAPKGSPTTPYPTYFPTKNPTIAGQSPTAPVTSPVSVPVSVPSVPSPNAGSVPTPAPTDAAYRTDIVFITVFTAIIGLCISVLIV